MPRVSVLLPVYQAAEVVGQAIDTILGQTAPPFEIVVADDGSTDGTGERVAELGPRCEGQGVRLALARFPENRGRGASRNLAVARAGGELVAWYDADDLWTPEKLARQVEAFARARAENPAGRLLLTCNYLRHESARDPGQILRPGPTIALDDIAAIHTRRHIQLQTILGPREVFLRTPFDETLNRAEDFDFALRFAALGGKVVNPDPEGPPLVHYFRGAANFGKEGRASNRRLVRKNAAIFRAAHVDARAFLAHKLGIGLARQDAPTDDSRPMPPGPVFAQGAGDGFDAARPGLERLADGALRIALGPGAAVEYLVSGPEGEIARARIEGLHPVPQPMLRDWFMAGGRRLVIRSVAGAWFPAERLLIARAASGLISVSSGARPPGTPDAAVTAGADRPRADEASP
ncbi:glycosyltransferase family 2 protein [Amaricoccus solimangrovi]|nr:glycosyltransferase family 2 protein [Amaricoccus solimangrovi]